MSQIPLGRLFASCLNACNQTPGQEKKRKKNRQKYIILLRNIPSAVMNAFSYIEL